MAKRRVSHLSQLGNVSNAIHTAGMKRMFEAATEVRNEVLRTLSGPRTGRTYSVPGTSTVTYTASAPGEAPAAPTGELRKSIEANNRSTLIEGGGGSISGYVGTDLEKGARLERGWTQDNGARVEPRPWLEPSFERASDRIRRILLRRWV